MAHYPWSPTDWSEYGCPIPFVFLFNMRAEPTGDGAIRLLLANHPMHGAAWDALEEHGQDREVVLILDGKEYCYYAQVGEDEFVYLVPSDDEEQELPENKRFLEKAFVLRLRW